MTASPNPVKAFFKSSASPDNHASNASAKTSTSARDNSRSTPKLKVTKPKTGPDQNSKKRSTLLNFISPSDPPSPPAPSSFSSFTSYASTFLPSTSLFASVTGTGSDVKTGVKSPKSKHSLFNRSKKQPERISSEQSTAGWARPWAAWGSGSGEAGKHFALSLNLDGQSSNDVGPTPNPSKALQAWIRPSKSSKSDTETTPTIEKSYEKFFRKKKKALVAFDPKTHGTDGIDNKGEGSGQIMLHPHHNLSNPSVTSSNTYPSSPPKDQPWATCQQYQPYSLQEQAYFYRQNQQQQMQQQQPYPSRTGVTLAVHDVFGLGKVIEMTLALFVAHDAFLFRRPIWMQCAVMIWEAIVVLLVIWGILRVVGLAEIVVWGVDDLVRGTFLMIKVIGNTIRMLIWR